MSFPNAGESNSLTIMDKSDNLHEIEPKIYDMNLIHDGFKAVRKVSAWKDGTIKFEMNLCSELTKLSGELKDGTYKVSPSNRFTINERGKTRYIHSGAIRDKVVQHVLCDVFVNPVVEKYLYSGNSASRKDKGVSHARERFERHLHNYWLKHRTNDGYLALLDFSKFYDNIQHDKVIDSFKEIVSADVLEVIRAVLKSFEVDVSYMTDAEYSNCMRERFDSVRYHQENHRKSKQRFMRKSVNIGDQLSQSIGIFFPTPIDNFVTCVRGHRSYGRYMDDSWIIHKDKDYLLQTVKGIEEQAEKLGLFINKKKTHIVRLDRWFTFLQRQYKLEPKGRVAKKIRREAIARERRRLKKYRGLILRGCITKEEVANCFKSWYYSVADVLSKRQKQNIKQLYKEITL